MNDAEFLRRVSRAIKLTVEGDTSKDTDRLEALAKRLEDCALVPRTPTTAMVEAGAQRLANWNDDCKWPDSWTPFEVSRMRRDAQKVYHSMIRVIGND